MARRYRIGQVLSGIMLIAVTACAQSQTPSSPSPLAESPASSVPTSTPTTSASNTPEESSSPIAEASPSPASRPATETATLTVEGEPEEIQLVLFEPANLPFSTYLPEGNFTDEATSSDEGTGVRLYWTFAGDVDESAYIHAFFPSQSMSLEAMKEFIAGDRGLMATNNWSEVNRTTDIPYPWAKEAIAFEENSEAGYFLGVIVIGERDGNAFYIASRYPAEYADGFQPRFELVLDHLELKN